MEIKNKLESINMIEELKLNKFSEKLFKKNQKSEIGKFLDENPAKYYAIRDKSKAGGTFKLKVEKTDIIEETKDYDLFTINVSSANYTENQLIVGEIMISSDNEVNAILSTNKTYSVRDAIKNPDFNIKTNIFDNKTLNNIPYFDNIYDYIITNDLLNVIVEFALFDKKIGIKKEHIIIYELRTHY